MRDLEIARAVRALRHRRGWRQRDVAAAAGVSQRGVSRLEAGHVEGFTLRTLRRIAAAVGLDISLDGRWRGGELARLLDADHAALATAFARHLTACGWLVAAELTFSRYGERGSYDLLAFHPGRNLLLVVEIKTVVTDIQQLLRTFDVKVRLAQVVARERGWNASAVVACLVVADGTTNRRRAQEHDVLLGRFALRGKRARAWLRSPDAGAGGLLLFLALPASRGRSARRAGRQRVRLGREPGSSNRAVHRASTANSDTNQPPGG